jgi:AraC-like DNA-binding protein
VLVLVFVILNIIFAVHVDFEFMGLIGNYSTILLVSLLLFFSLGHSGIHEGVERDLTVNDSNQEALNPQLKDRLLRCLETEKIYLRSNLTLDRLAEHLSLSPKLLSGVINRQLNQNFFELINSYRIDEAKTLLLRAPEKTGLSVIFEAGFNSKATFNTIFKRKVGLTPTEFREKNSSKRTQ